GCPAFVADGAAPDYVAQVDGFEAVECAADEKTCKTPEDGNQGLQSNVFEPCLEDIAPGGATCLEVAERWTAACQEGTQENNTLLQDGFTCGCMSAMVQNGTYCQRTCGLCSPVFVNKDGFRSASPADLEPETSLARGIVMYQKPLPRIPCEAYDVAAVAEAVRSMHVPDTQPDLTLDIPPTVRIGFHDATDFDKWSGTGGADGRIYNSPEAWFAETRTVNAGLICPYKLMAAFNGTSLSPGDAIHICSMVAVEMSGGPSFEDFNFEPGRVLAKGIDRDGGIASPLGNNVMIRDFFYRSGLDDADIVALSGAHTLGGGQGQKGSGFGGDFTPAPDTFSNDYFVQLVAYENVTTDGCDYFGPGTTPESRTPENMGGGCAPATGVMQLPSDRALMLDKGFRDLVVLYANDQQAFFDQYTKSVKKMSELGRDVSVQWCDYTGQASDPVGESGGGGSDATGNEQTGNVDVAGGGSAASDTGDKSSSTSDASSACLR
ncbi:hypothetical protein ACHAWF_015853, partial [Thalassiosira exigua]